MAYKRNQGRRVKRLSKRDKDNLKKFVLILILIVIAFFAGALVAKTVVEKRYQEQETQKTGSLEDPEIDVDLLDVNEYSRPGIALEKVNGIVIHYTANPGASAKDNRDYFNNLQYTHKTKASSHFIVGIDGEIVQCIPTAEISYASNDRNSDTIAIECCIPDESGAFTEATYDSVIYLTAWLCEKFSLDSKDVIRHYDITGKMCPKYYVKHEDKWKKFKKDVQNLL